MDKNNCFYLFYQSTKIRRLLVTLFFLSPSFNEFLINEFPKKPTPERGRESPETAYRPKNKRKFQITGWEVQSPYMQIRQTDLKSFIQLIKTI